MAQQAETPADGIGDERRRRDWYALEERHATLQRVRVAGLAAVALAALVVPRDLSSRDRALAVAACAAAIVLHLALALVPLRWERRLLLAADASLVVDAALVVALAELSGGPDGLGLWLLPLVALAVTLGYSVWFGVKALVLGGIAAAALVAIAQPDGPGAEEVVGPLVLAAAVVAVAGVLIVVDRRDTERSALRATRLHAASSTLLIAEGRAAVLTTARIGVEDVLPGWEVTVALGGGPAEMRLWRDGDRSLVEVPIPAGAGGPLGRITASRRRPRFRAHVRARQLEEIRGLAAAAGAALERIADIERLSELSLADALTGLGNRRAFDQALEEELARGARTGAPVGLVVLDVDHFKRFNDRHGHQAGDEALATVAGVLAREARTEDRACRIGGEEFALLLPGADEAAAAGVAERIRRGVEASEPPAEPVTVSLGVAATRGGTDARRLFAEADARLYAAKTGGRNRVVAAASA